MAILLVP